MAAVYVSDNISANGVMRLSINACPPGSPPRTRFVAQEANTWTFTTLASAINLGLEILETPMGRDVLRQLGHHVVQGWHVKRMHRFGGDVRYMDFYVDHFLAATRSDFPYVLITSIWDGNIDTLAEYRRHPPSSSSQWDGNLQQYRPKLAGGIAFQYTRVADMADAAQSAGSRRMSERHKWFQFMFGCATAHELCHAFVGYLAQGASNDFSRCTPPDVTYLNYNTGIIRGGESGRWFERNLFGGSIEFYRDVDDDDGQSGIPFLVDDDEVSWRIDPRFIEQLVTEPRVLEFPFRVLGPGLSEQDRWARGLQVMGWGQPPALRAGRRLLMTARMPQNTLAYNISHRELREIPIRPRRLRNPQLVGP